MGKEKKSGINQLEVMKSNIEIKSMGVGEINVGSTRTNSRFNQINVGNECLILKHICNEKYY